MNKRTLIPERVFFRIGDVAEILGVNPYVIRFWEGEFPFVAPEKSSTGQRVYRRAQIEGLVLVKHLLHIERYSIEGAKKKLTELRKQAKLKDTMLQLIQGGSPFSGGPLLDQDLANGEQDVISKELKIGDTVPKDQIASLKEKLNELQVLIRQPESVGVEVPKLNK